MTSPFLKKRQKGSTALASKMSEQLSAVHSKLNGGLAATLGVVGKSVYSPESMDLSDAADVGHALDEVSSIIGSVFSFEEAKLGKSGDMATAEYQFGRGEFADNAARLAAALGMSPRQAAHRDLSLESMVAAPRRIVIAQPPGVGDFFTKLPEDINVGLEAYDEKNNKDAVAFSVVWNANFRQSPWAEAFYPLYLLTPDQLGLTFTVPVVQVQPELRRDTSGDPTNFNRRNVMRALVDPSIIEDDATDIIPVVRPSSADKFPDASLIAPTSVVVAGETVQTAPLLFGKTIGLLSIGQTEALLASGAADTSDAVDPSVKLETVYAQIGNKAVRWDVSGMSYTDFNYSVQDEYRKMVVNTSFKNLLISKDTKSTDGANLPGLDVIYTDGLEVRVQMDVNGWIVLESGDVRLSSVELLVTGITDPDGNRLAPTDPKYVAIADVLENPAQAKPLSYRLRARRTNSNMRQRGQLLNTNFYTQLHGVPRRAPITVARPQSQSDQNDGADMAALLQTTYARATNAAHAEFFRHAAFLEQFVGSQGSHIGEMPEILGVSRLCGVQPFFERLELDIEKVVQITSTEDKTRAVMEAICYTLRDQVYRGWTKSEFMVALSAMRGPGSPNPTVIVGVPPYLRNYLQIFGDIRIFGENFEYRIVESLNPLHKDTIVWSFGFFDGGDGQPNPLHFGLCAMRPEVTAVLSLPRNGSYSKELTVVPSFLHISNLPVVGMVKVIGLEALALTSLAVPVKMIP